MLLFLIVLTGCKPICTIEQIEYNDTEEYVNSTLVYELISMYKYTDMNDSDIIAGAIVNVRNVDDQEGEFIVEQQFILANGTRTVINITKNIKPGESQQFEGVVIADTEEEESILISGQVYPPPKIYKRIVTRYMIQEVCE